jgi:hypothetical protein
MHPTAFTCRAQEARQRQQATDALLPNVRGVAFIAAAAWRKEALAAEKREAREIATRLHRIESRLERSTEDRDLSENPDRGFADRPVLRALG